MNRKVLEVGLIVFTLGVLVPAQAQRVSIDAALHPADKPYIEAIGEAAVTTKPDQALIEIVVTTQGATAMAATAENARQTDATLAVLRKLLGAGASNHLRTAKYSVRPSFRYPNPGAAPEVTGYTVTNVLQVTLDDLAQISKVIDGATQAGGNIVQALEYRLKDPRAAHGQALREAAEAARANVEAIASGLGMKVVRVLSAEQATSEDEFGAHKKVAPVSPAGITAATPIEVGPIEVDATVTLRVEIAP